MLTDEGFNPPISWLECLLIDGGSSTSSSSLFSSSLALIVDAHQPQPIKHSRFSYSFQSALYLHLL